MIKENIQSLMDEKMDRKKFLAFSGSIILGILGITGLMNIILKSHVTGLIQNNNQHPVQTSGYGGSTYGDK